MERLESKHQHRTFTHTVHAAPDKVFPLLCPVREFEWLEHWDCQLVHSRSGKAEKGCVFTTVAPGEETAVWIITRHDPEAGIVEFTSVIPGSRVRVLEIALNEEAEQRTALRWSHIFTTLGQPGEDFLEQFTDKAYQESMNIVALSLDHFCRTGQRLTRAEIEARQQRENLH